MRTMTPIMETRKKERPRNWMKSSCVSSRRTDSLTRTTTTTTRRAKRKERKVTEMKTMMTRTTTKSQLPWAREELKEMEKVLPKGRNEETETTGAIKEECSSCNYFEAWPTGLYLYDFSNKGSHSPMFIYLIKEDLTASVVSSIFLYFPSFPFVT